MTQAHLEASAAAEIALLVGRARGGDEEAFAALVQRYERSLLAHFLAKTPTAADAEELAHDTFVRAYLSLERLDDPTRFGPWLFGIARNCLREWSRDRHKRSERPEPPPGERAEVLQRKASLDREIFRIVSALQDPYREVLLMRYFSGASSPEIARMLGRPLGTVTKQVSRAHAMVAERVKSLRGYTTLLHFLLPKGGAGD